MQYFLGTLQPGSHIYATASNSTSQMDLRMQRVAPVAEVVRMYRLPYRKCVRQAHCSPLIYCQRGKQVGAGHGAAGESWPRAESATFSTTGAGGGPPASQPYLQVPCLSWIPGMWNATTDHGGAVEFPLASTYQHIYLSTLLPSYPHDCNYLSWIP